MSSVESGSTRVLKAFVAGANAQYREAGLGKYQMRVRKDGAVDRPNAPPAGQARAGAKTGPAAATSSAAGAAKAGAAATVAGSPPTLTKVDAPSTDSVRLTWDAVPGATRYGIWQDGQLIGTVPNPSFVAKIAANGTSVLEIDAELAGGRRSPKTPAVQVKRAGEGAVQAQVAQQQAASAAQGAQQQQVASTQASQQASAAQGAQAASTATGAATSAVPSATATAASAPTGAAATAPAAAAG